MIDLPLATSANVNYIFLYLSLIELIIIFLITGTGYQLNILKLEGCIVQNVTTTVKQHVPDAEVKTEMASVLSYNLPSEQTSKFPLLFEALERNKELLSISSIGVSITTLEEVFLR